MSNEDTEVLWFSEARTARIMPKFLLFLLIPIAAASQGPLDGYLKGKGVLDLSPSFSFHKADKFQGANAVFDVPYQGQSLQLFAAYGVSGNCDLVGTAAMVFTPRQSGLQDGSLHLKYRPWLLQTPKAGKLAVLAGAGISFPMTNYTPTTTGALGQKAISPSIRLIIQWETPPGIFLNVTAAHHLRLDRPSEADIAMVRKTRPDYVAVGPRPFSTLLFKAGFPARHFYLDGWVEWQISGGGNDYLPGTVDLAQAFGVSYTQLGGTLFYTDNGVSGFFFSTGIILNGRNTALSRRLTFGTSRKLDFRKAGPGNKA